MSKLLIFAALIAIAFAAVSLETSTVTRDSKTNNIEWSSIIKNHKENVLALVKEFKSEMSDEFTNAWKNETNRKVMFPSTYLDELTNIATLLDVDLIDIAWYNYYLDKMMFTVVSGDDGFKTIPSASFVSFCQDGACHGFSMNPVSHSSKLRDVAVIIADGDNTGVAFAGMVGFFFGMKKEAVSISFNNLADTQNNKDILTIPAALNSVNIRGFVEEKDITFEKTINYFKTEGNKAYASGVFYSVAGPNEEDASVCEIVQNASTVCRSLNDKTWYLAQAAEEIKEEKYIADNDTGIVANITESAKKVGKSHMKYAALEDRITTWPGRNIDTVGVISAHVSSNDLSVILNGCHNIYKDFSKEKVSQCVEDAEIFNLGVTIVSILIACAILAQWYIGAQNAKKAMSYKPIAE